MNKILTILLLLFISTSYSQEKSLEKLVAENRGKVILIDFWASWCKPCLSEMPASRKLKEKYKDKPVVFMYISIDESKSDWKKASEREGLHLEKYNLRNVVRDGQFAPFKINSIPRYMLVDKKGKLVNVLADRPSSSLLARDIDKYLAE